MNIYIQASIVARKPLCVLVHIFKIGLDVPICRSKLPVYSQRKKNKTTKNPITELLNIARRKNM